MHPSFASKYKPDLSLFTTLLRKLHHNRASRPKAVSQTENCTSFFLRLTHQTLPEFNGFSLHFSPSFPKVKLVYAGHTHKMILSQILGPVFLKPNNQGRGAQSVAWLQTTVCPNTPQCGALVRLLCCSQLSRSLPDLESWILNMFDMYDFTPGCNGGIWSESTDQEASATGCRILLQLQKWQRAQSSSETGFDPIGAKLNGSQDGQLTALTVLHICEIPRLWNQTNKPSNDHPRHFYFLLLSQTLNRVLRWMVVLQGNASPSALHPLKAYMLLFLGQSCSSHFSFLLWRASLQRKSNSCLYPEVFFREVAEILPS